MISLIHAYLRGQVYTMHYASNCVWMYERSLKMYLVLYIHKYVSEGNTHSICPKPNYTELHIKTLEREIPLREEEKTKSMS